MPAGGGRLYIYGEFQYRDQTVLSPNFDITVDGGTITGAWNYNGPGQDGLTGDQRWNAATPNPLINPGGNTVSFTSANLTHMGLMLSSPSPMRTRGSTSWKALRT